MSQVSGISSEKLYESCNGRDADAKVTGVTVIVTESCWGSCDRLLRVARSYLRIITDSSLVTS